MVTYTLKIVEIIKETDDTATICFKQPGLKKINYKPGQYLTLVVNVNNRKYKRPYSLSSAPGINSTLNITVKRLLHGVVSNHLIDVIKEGDLLEVIEPMGDFTYQTELHSGKEVFLWGAGSGITPLMSILQTVLHNTPDKVNLFYCSKKVAQTIFYEQLAALKAQYGDRFSLNLFCTEEQGADILSGRINSLHVIESLTGTDMDNTIHYICGPLGLKETVKGTLLDNGLAAEQIFSEDFEHIINANELQDIETRFVEIIQGGEKKKIEVVRGKSVLEAGLDSNMDLPYSCQTGSCTLCKATLVSGEVKKIGNQKMDHELTDNERLLCCSYPLTESVIFEIN